MENEKTSRCNAKVDDDLLFEVKKYVREKHRGFKGVYAKEVEQALRYLLLLEREGELPETAKQLIGTYWVIQLKTDDDHTRVIEKQVVYRGNERESAKEIVADVQDEDGNTFAFMFKPFS